MRWGVVNLLFCAVAGLSAVSDEGAASLGPQPHGVPLASPQVDLDSLPAEERLLRNLDRAARERDERIQAILRVANGVRPVAASDLGPGLAMPRAERDRALADLRAALEDYLGRTHRGESDVLDPSGAARQARQVQPLSANNRIAIAECLQQLAGEESGVEREHHLGDGLAELEALPAEVPEELRPRAAYLRVWFLAEQARLPGDPAQRTEQAARARARAADFAGSFPSSELAPAVASLVADLPGGEKKTP